MKQVTLIEDDFLGNFTSNTDCPIARALKRVLPEDTDIYVETYRIKINGEWKNTGYIGLYAIAEAREKGKAIIKFDVDILH